jgi:hypothetical protein
MTDNSIGKSAGGAIPPFLVELAKNASAMMWTFTATTFLSALLLFAIQPMFAKMVLPVLGGSPSVWSVSVFFFQAALLAGYLYAHLLISKAPPHLTGIIHLAVCVLALICLPIGMVRWMGDPPQGEPYLWQLGMFAVSIGLPFVAVSANAPLLQAWFARSGHPDARDPYFMYAASNLGSLIALLSYPFILEPAFGLSQLSHLWAYAYVILVLAIGVSFFLMRGAQVGGAPETVAQPGAGDAASPATAPSWIDRLSWIGLAFVPAALVTAFTVHITTDVASAPLLWVFPLALYLLTFVLVFRDRPFVSREALLFLHLLALVIALVALSFQTHDWFIISATGVTVFFTTAMLAHRTLYEARPAPAYLTEFYLWMSFGGALGGMFTALVAPKLFSEIYEYPLLLAASMACRPGALSFLFSRDRQKLKDEMIVLWLIAAVGVLIIWWLPTLIGSLRASTWAARVGTTPFTVMVLAAILLVNVKFAPRQLVAAGLMCLALVTLPSAVRQADSQITQRSFFGVYRVADTPDGYRTLVHGTTLHGAQRIYDEEGKEVEDLVPTTYYYPGSPMGRTIAKRREILAAKGEKGHYGIVGLGTGSSACHKQEGESWRFFEIDPTVIKISSNPKNFTFISKCQPDIDIAIGDARLTIAKEPDASFDLFIIDAFTSDAIPVHMLTKEAVQLFLDKLKPEGVVLLHTSNRYLDLNSVLAAIQKELPEGTAGIAMQDAGGDGYGESGSTVVIFAKSEAALQPYRSMEGVLELDDGSGNGAPLRAWTDDYSDILGAFWSRLQGRG